jgi:hypothetical protein
MEKMVHFFDNIYYNFTSKDKHIWAVATFMGWFCGMNFFNPLFIGPILSAAMSIVIASCTALAGAITLDFYKLKIKDKIFKKKK